MIPRSRGFRIYALIDPRSGDVRYVGKSCGYLNSRLRAHIHEAMREPFTVTHKKAWVRSLIRAGVEPQLKVLEECSDAAALAECERDWIARLRASGSNLTNMTAGGEGMFDPSEETRARLRARPRQVVTAKMRQARSESMRARWADPVEAERMRARQGPNARHARQMHGAEYAAFKIENAKRMGAGLRGVPKSPEHRRKLADAVTQAHAEGRLPSRRGIPHSESTRAKMRAAWVRRKAG